MAVESMACRSRQRGTFQMTYRKLSKLEPGSLVNVYGYILEATRRQSYDACGLLQDEIRFKIKDGKISAAVDVTVYGMKGFLKLEEFARGRLIRLRRIRVNKLKDGSLWLFGRVNLPTSVVIFEVPEEGDFTFNQIVYSSSKGITHSDEDDRVLRSIRRFKRIIFDTSVNDDQAASNASQAQERPRTGRRATMFRTEELADEADSPGSSIFASPRRRTPISSPSKQTQTIPLTLTQGTIDPDANEDDANVPRRLGPPFALMEEMEIFQKVPYYDFCAQVVAVYDGRECTFLQVFDGTQFPISRKKCSLPKDLRLIWRNKSLVAKCEHANLLHIVICYGEHRNAALELPPDSLVTFINLHSSVVKNSYPSLSQLVMHSGCGFKFVNNQQVSANRHIEILKPSSIVYQVLKRQLEDAVKRLPDVQIAEDLYDEMAADRALAMRLNEEEEIIGIGWSQELQRAYRREAQASVPATGDNLSTQPEGTGNLVRVEVAAPAPSVDDVEMVANVVEGGAEAMENETPEVDRVSAHTRSATSVSPTKKSSRSRINSPNVPGGRSSARTRSEAKSSQRRINSPAIFDETETETTENATPEAPVENEGSEVPADVEAGMEEDVAPEVSVDRVSAHTRSATSVNSAKDPSNAHANTSGRPRSSASASPVKKSTHPLGVSPRRTRSAVPSSPTAKSPLPHPSSPASPPKKRQRKMSTSTNRFNEIPISEAFEELMQVELVDSQ